MTSLVISKGQPFRFGMIETTKSNENTSVINYVSEADFKQTKACSTISIVPISNSYISPAMAMTMAMARLAPEPTDFFSQHSIWPSLKQNTINIFIVNRPYLLNIIKLMLPSSINSEKQKVEQRKLLRNIENSWNSSVKSPRTESFVIRNSSWNNRQLLLFPERYHHYPIGSIVYGSTGEPLYKSEDYPPDTLRYDPSHADQRIGELANNSGTIFLYVDNLKISSTVSWPEVLGKNASPFLSEALRAANIFVIDYHKRISLYETALDRKLYSKLTDFSSIFPSFGIKFAAYLQELAFDVHSTLETAKGKDYPSTRNQFKASDLMSVANMLHDLYPLPGKNQIIPPTIIASALAFFSGNAHKTKWLELSGGLKLPEAESDTRTIANILFGSTITMLMNICNQTTGVLLVRKSDILKYFSHLSSANQASQFARILFLDSNGNIVETRFLGIAQTLDLLRYLQNTKLENPYKLARSLVPYKLNELRNIPEATFTVAILDDLL
jgi:hypothetical protein